MQAKWELPQLVKYHTTLKEKLDAKSKQAKNPKYEKGSKIKDSYGVAQSVITELFAIKDGVVDNLEQQKSIIEQEIAKYPKENNPAKSKLKTLLKLVDSFIKQERDCDKKVVQISNKVDDEFEKFKQQYKKFLDESSIKITMEEEDEVRQAKEQVQKAEGLAKKYDKLFTGREELLNQLETLRDNFTKIREEKYKELTNKSADRLRLSLIKGDNKELFRTKIKELLSHSGTKPETYIDSLIERNTSRQFVNKIIAEKTNELQNDIGQNTQVDCEKIVAHLKNKIVELLPLQYQWVYIDEPKIELNVKPLESEPYKELSQLSVGQKSTALLVISLLEGCSPVLIDQPEDALDLKSVIQDVSERLRQYKTRRQFILTTHNSSVAVSSDSDKYFILEPEGDKGRLLFSGAIDTEAIREQVINYLEGGTKSYDLKRKKYKKS
ncbi:MAG: AAA family ATPase [Candidatus Nealsonbacteria bacterium]|nr:AAA family ATPase [Candidatus Nealsonbacteria bacterium]